MADARIPERWLNDRRVIRLSPVDLRSFIFSLVWSVSNRTDGELQDQDLELIPGFSRASIGALERAELWCPIGGGWLIVDYEATQTSRSTFESLDGRRATDRDRKARQRAHQSGDHKLCLPDSPCHVTVPRTSARNSTRTSPHKSTVTHRQGQARQEPGSKAAPEEPERHLHPAPDPWADVPVAIPGGAR